MSIPKTDALIILIICVFLFDVLGLMFAGTAYVFYNIQTVPYVVEYYEDDPIEDEIIEYVEGKVRQLLKRRWE